MKTLVLVPPNNPAYRMGCTHVHVGIWQAPEDPDKGHWPAVAIQIPETPRAGIKAALADARALRARLIVVADTPEQLEAVVPLVAKRLPKWRRVPLERWVADITFH